MKIEVLGVGCAKCNKLEENVRQAIRELGLDAEVDHVRDLTEISRRGVFMTPGLVVDGKVVSSARVPSVEKLKGILRKIT